MQRSRTAGAPWEDQGGGQAEGRAGPGHMPISRSSGEVLWGSQVKARFINSNQKSGIW